MTAAKGHFKPQGKLFSSAVLVVMGLQPADTEVVT